MSFLPFTKSKHQHGDEAVSREVESRKLVKRWRGIEIGFQFRSIKITSKVRPKLQIGAAALEVETATDAKSYPWDCEETQETKRITFCLMPPDPSAGPDTK